MYTILLTDDEPIVTDSLAFIIEKNFPNQTQILKALSGSDAIYLSRSNKIDIHFMDINMPGVNGLETIEEIKQFNPSAIIIILSAFDRFQYAQEALALGAYRYLTKPANQNVLTQTIRNAMSMVDAFRGKLSNNTVLGRHIYAVGGNPEAAELSGINVQKITTFVFASMSALAGLSGILFTARLQSATTTAGVAFELDAIASCYVGGVSASGGVGKVTGTIIGALIMSSLSNGMNLMNIGISYQYIVRGAVLVLAVMFDVRARRMKL